MGIVLLRLLLSLSASVLVAPFLAAPAHSAELVAGATPLALHATEAAPACPTALEVDGSLRAAASRVAAGPHGAFSDSYVGAASFALSVATTVAVCDPELAASGRPLGPITGAAVNPPTADTVGAGLRMLGATITEPAAAVAVGDRFVLPAVGARSTVDLVVRTPTGSSPVRLGPFASAPVAVKIDGTSQAPVAVAELSDGTTAQAAVSRPRATGPRLRATIRKNRVKLRLTGAPGAFLVAAQAPSPGDVRVVGYDPNGVVQVANAEGVARGVVSDLRRAKYVLVGILDADRRIFTPLTCRLSWKGRTLRRVTCRPTTASEQARPFPGGSPGPLASEFAAQPLLSPATSVQPSTSDRWREAHRTTSAAPALAPVDTTVVTRLRGRATIMFDSDDVPLVGDVNGDGRPDFGIGGPRGKPKIALSAPGLWSRVPLLADDASDLFLVPDLTGDGTDDFALPFEERVVSGARAWAAALPSSIDLRRQRALTAGDLSLPSSGDRGNGSLQFALPDTTDDGRPELGVHPIDGHGFAVFASETVPLGRASLLPSIHTTSFAEELGEIRKNREDGSDEDLAPDAVDGVLASRGGALLWHLDAKRVERGPTVNYASTITVAPIPSNAPWTPRPSAPLVVDGYPKVDDYDAATGEALVTTNFEACDLRTYTCTARVRRIDAAGKVTATATVRAEVALTVSASFANDGPDVDDRAEVLIHDDPGAASADVAGLGRTVALWGSTTPTVDVASLPMLASGGAPIFLSGPLLSWTAPDGRRQHAGFVETGSGKALTQTLTLLGSPR